MRSLILGILLTVWFGQMTVATPAIAQPTTASPVVGYEDIFVLAKAAVVSEGNRFNSELSSGQNVRGYRQSQVKFLVNKMGNQSIDPQYLVSKCMLDSSDLSPLTRGTALSQTSDTLIAQTHALSDVRANYPSAVWKIVAKACENSEAQFIARLRSLSSRGTPVTLDERTVRALGHLIFFPTESGKPTLKAALWADLNLLASATLISGMGLDLVGNSIAKFLIDPSVMTNAAMGASNSFLSLDRLAGKLDASSIPSESLVDLDFTPVEQNIKSASHAATGTSGFLLTSPDVAHGFTPKFAFNGLGCTGADVSPEIDWSRAPQAARSFVLTVYDPTAPTGSGFWHWIVIDIPAGSTSIPQATSGAGIGRVISNDFGQASYDGPCPPPGATDSYVFTVYALNIDKFESLPGFPANPTNAEVRFFLQASGAILDRASFTVNYKR